MKLPLTASVVAISLATVTATATAQPATEPPPPPPPEAAPDIDPGVLEDANSGRTWLSPTALTAPAGTWSFHDHMLFFVGGGYSPTDNVSLSLSTMVPLTNDFPLVLFATGKVQLLKQGRLRLAAHGSLFHVGVDDSGDVEDDDLSVSTGTLGGVATLCLDDGCHSFVNGYLAGGFILEDVDQSSVPFAANIAWVQRLSKHVKLVLEADTGFILGEVDDIGNGFLGWYGLRFTSKNIGVDLGFVKPFVDDTDSDVLPLGFPWVSFTYRGI